MRIVRYWSTSHARAMEKIYTALESTLVVLHPLWNFIGYERLEKPFAAIEKVCKAFLFDCQMCGQCALKSTGMSCPMNCPKQLRNGPCGGVSAQGRCEVKPDIRCVWVEAVRGAQTMAMGHLINTVQLPIDRKLQGQSSWLREVRRKVEMNKDIKRSASNVSK
jgi:Methylene-tetrahydrofolate reductase C terminal